MKTQKFMAGFMLTMMLLASISTMVLAENETIDAEAITTAVDDSQEVESTNVEITSGFQNGWDKFRLAFTFNNEKKAELALNIAEKRLADLEALAEEGSVDEETLEKARERYENFLEKAEDAAEKIQARKESQTEDSLVKAETIQNRIQEHSEKVEAIKARILEMKAEGNLSDEQLAHLDEVFSRIENRTQQAEAKLEQRQEALRTRYKVMSEKSDEEIEAALEQRREEIKEKVQARVNDDSEDDDSEDNETNDDSEDDDSEVQAKTGQTEEE